MYSGRRGAAMVTNLGGLTAIFFVGHAARAASHFFGCESCEDVAQRFTFYTRQQGALSQPLCSAKKLIQECSGECGGHNDTILCANTADI